jgi:tetratricopeptide (TPR) repeat protein
VRIIEDRACMAAITVEQALQLATVHQQSGQLTAAEAMCRRVLEAQPHHAGAWHQLGTIAISGGRYGEAAEWFAQAVAQSPEEGRYHCDLGVSYRLLERLEDAAVSFQKALALRPDLAEAHLNLTEALTALGRFDEAMASGHQLLDRFGDAPAEFIPIRAEAYNHLGNALLKSRKPEEAAASYESALRLKPDYADAWSNLGIAFFQTHQLERAMHCYRQAIALRPDFARAHANLALLLLLRGDYAEGWREQEWRLRSSDPARGLEARIGPQWNGTPAPGQTLLIHAEQGFGDMLQFFRYLPLVRERSEAHRVILSCQRELVRLLSKNSGEVKVVANDAESMLPPFDQQLPLLSLPLALNLLEPWHPESAYLRADPELRARWRDLLGPRSSFRVGLAWAGNAQQGEDRSRSMTFEHLLPLLRIPQIDFYRLQIAAPEAENRPVENSKLIDLTSHITDFADTAALMAELDLIITVDTAAAHLAGAMALPVWTLLSLVPAWRWGLEGAATPWYPTLRLFRQKTAGDWDEVIQRVVGELIRIQSEPSESFHGHLPA